jgi:hypothetical protein
LELIVKMTDEVVRQTSHVSKMISHSFPLSEISQAFEFAEWQGKGAGTAATRVILKP